MPTAKSFWSRALELLAGRLPHAAALERLAVELFRSYHGKIADEPFGSIEAISRLLPDAAPAALRHRFFAEVPAGIMPEKRVPMVRNA